MRQVSCELSYIRILYFTLFYITHDPRGVNAIQYYWHVIGYVLTFCDAIHDGNNIMLLLDAYHSSLLARRC